MGCIDGATASRVALRARGGWAIIARLGATAGLLAALACSSDDPKHGTDARIGDGRQPLTDGGQPLTDGGLPLTDGAPPPPPPACAAVPGGGSATVAAPQLKQGFRDSWHEGWVSSVAVVDLDGDGGREIVCPREERLIVWRPDGTKVFHKDVGGRIWASPVVADLLPSRPGLEIAATARESLYVWDAQGQELPGFPVTWRDELRTLAAGDIDGDGQLELVVVTTSALSKGNQEDIVMAYELDGSAVPGFPPNTTGVGGCDDKCWITGGYDQNLAIGDVNGDGKADIWAPQDNAYMSLHEGSGRLFDAAPIFEERKKWPGIRFLLDYAFAQRGYPDDDEVHEQAHFTNSAPAIVDLDGDGKNDLVVLGSVQNAAQTDRFRGVALWALHPDGTRLAGWERPLQVKDYLSGLWDFEGTNIAGATNQVTVVELDPQSAGPELVFAGFDGQIHCVGAAKDLRWSYRYTADDDVLTPGLVAADLSGDGVPELVFATYSTEQDKSHLFVLGANGALLHKLPLPNRGSMAVPTIADMDGDGALEILLNLKDGENELDIAQAYTVPGSADNCLLWPTGRGNLLRNGFVQR